MDRQMDIQIDNRWIDGQIGRQINGWMDRQLDGQVDRYMDGWMYGQLDR